MPTESSFARAPTVSHKTGTITQSRRVTPEAANAPAKAQPTAPQRDAGVNREEVPPAPFPFQLLNVESTSDGLVFAREGAHGTEWTRGVPAEGRRRVPSFNQREFPEPESGCGPVAILNWLTWYQDMGMLRKPFDSPNPMLRARHNHSLIEEEILSMRERVVARRGGTTGQEIVATIDRLVHRLSEGSLRMSYELHAAPMSISDLSRFTQGFRSAILVVRPVDPVTGQLQGLHAVSVVAGDRNGYLMLNNWGMNLYGMLRNKADGQFFHPQNEASPSLRIEQLICLIPFSPDDPRHRTVADLPERHRLHRPTSIAPRPTQVSVRPRLAANPASQADITFSPPVRVSGKNRYRVRAYNRSNAPLYLFMQNVEGRFSNGRRYTPTLIESVRNRVYRMGQGGVGGRLLQPGAQIDLYIEFNTIDVRFHQLEATIWRAN